MIGNLGLGAWLLWQHRSRFRDRQAAMKFAFRHAGVDTVTVGYKNTAEIDEAIENLNAAFA